MFFPPKNVPIGRYFLLMCQKGRNPQLWLPFKGIFINFNKFATGSTCIDKIEMFMKGFLGYQVEDQHQHDIQEYMVNNLEDYERTVQETLSKGIF